ncbi:MAG: NmrA/HSCARG family protein [Gammaproteobacteria bacterium]|jgi:uncharacterized protein YbjT (DUF2867 family)|nr:NmrA/HSCARG family protein [Gammaproteobacteria bacterium]
MLRLIGITFLSLILVACEKINEPQLNPASAKVAAETEKIILVTGATGRQGGAVAAALLKTGFKVRGLSRNPESERAQAMTERGVSMVKGDFNDSTSLDSAMRGVYGVFLVTNFWEHGFEAEVQQGKNVVDAAGRNKLEHLIFTSVANADEATGIPHFESKYEIEQYIHSVNIPYTILRPVSFMENWEYSKERINAGKISSPFSLGTRVQHISVRDIGRMAALAFTDPENWLSRSLDIAGDENSMKQIVNLFSSVTGSPVEYIQIPWDVYEKEEGEEMTIMDRWIDNTGYSANINLVRSQLKDMLTLEDYLHEAKW